MDLAALRQHIETTLEDEALQRLLDDAEGAITTELGPPGAVVEYASGGGTLLVLGRAIDVLSPVEVTIGVDSTTPVVLADDDYRIRPGGFVLERLASGTNPADYWPGVTTSVSFIAADDTATRDRVTIELCRLDLAYSPLLSQRTIDGYSEQMSANSAWNYKTERDMILATLTPVTLGFA